MSTNVVAKSVPELLSELKKHSKNSTVWLVDRGPFGHASIIIYDKDYNELVTIRNKD